MGVTGRRARQLEPGDLVFYEGEYYSPTAKRQLHDMVHGARLLLL